MIEEYLHIGHPGAEIGVWKFLLNRADLRPDIRAQLVADFGGIAVHGVQQPLVIRAEAEEGFFVFYDFSLFILLLQVQLIPLFLIGPAGIPADIGLQDAGGGPVSLCPAVPEIDASAEDLHIRRGLRLDGNHRKACHGQPAFLIFLSADGVKPEAVSVFYGLLLVRVSEILLKEQTDVCGQAGQRSRLPLLRLHIERQVEGGRPNIIGKLLSGKGQPGKKWLRRLRMGGQKLRGLPGRPRMEGNRPPQERPQKQKRQTACQQYQIQKKSHPSLHSTYSFKSR